jgi:hypothetical protein
MKSTSTAPNLKMMLLLASLIPSPRDGLAARERSVDPHNPLISPSEELLNACACGAYLQQTGASRDSANSCR